MVWVDELFLNMNDGDGKEGLSSPSSDKESRQLFKKTKISGSHDFARAIARIAVAQVCEGLGFQSFHRSALETLADVGVRYIEEIGKRAASCSNLANRSECNAFDVVQGLEDLCSVQGFTGASDPRPSVLGSGVVKDILRYVSKNEEIPFAYLIPDFPVVKKRHSNVSFAQAEFGTPDEHIPKWLPMFPVEGGWHQRTACNVSEVDVITIEPMDGSKGPPATQKNPFLAPPLRFEEKEVSLPTFPTKLLGEASRFPQSCDAVENDVSHSSRPVMPIQDAAAEGILNGHEGKRDSLLHGRQNVQFKFRSRKKSVGSGMSPCNGAIEKASDWFGDDRDEKTFEKRNYQISVDNLEYLQEAAQL